MMTVPLTKYYPQAIIYVILLKSVVRQSKISTGLRISLVYNTPATRM
jgi:hypothetical protein